MDYTPSKSLYKIWQLLTIPHYDIADAVEQQAASRLLIYLLLITITTVVNLIAWTLFYGLAVDALVGTLVSAVLYGMSFYISYRLAVHLTIITTLSLPFITYILVPNEMTIFFVLVTLIVAIFLASQFLSLRANLYVIISAFATLIFLQRGDLVMIDTRAREIAMITPLVIMSTLGMLNAFGYERLSSMVRERSKPNHRTHLQQAMRLIPDASIMTYKNHIIFANDAAVRMFGIERSVLIGEAINTFMETDKSTNFSIAKSSNDMVLEYTNTLEIPDQHARRVTITTRTLPYEDDVATLMIIRPQSVQYDAQLLNQMVAQSIDAMVVTDNDIEQGPHVVMVNPTFTKITGYRSDDLLGATLGDVLGEQATPTPLDAIREGILASDEVNGIVNMTSKQGTPLQLAWTLHAVHDDAQAITHYVISHRDVSEQQALVRNISNNEGTFRVVSEMMSDYAYALRVNADESLQIDWVSGDVKTSTGLSEESAKKLADWESLVHVEDRSFYHMRQKALLSGRTRHLEYRIVRGDGVIRWVSDSAYPIISPDTGKVTRILGAVHDVTERVMAQDTLRAHVVQQAVVAELGMLALNTRDADQLITHASVLCEQVLDIALSVVYGYDPQAHTFACLSASRDDIDMAVGYTFSDDYLLSLAGHTLHTNEAVISKDLADEPLFKPLAPIRDAGYGSGLGVIIFGSDAPFGVLAVYSEHIQDFTQEEIYFVQAIANVIGTFVERNRAQAAEIEQAEFAEALRDATTIINSNLDLPDVLGKMLMYIMQVVPKAMRVSIMLQDKDSEVDAYYYASTWGFPDDADPEHMNHVFQLDVYPLLQEMAETQQVIRIEDVHKDPRWIVRKALKDTTAYLGAPIIVRDECIGFINIHAVEKSIFDARDARRLQTFADKTGTALVNARKQEELEHLVIERTAELSQRRAQFEAIFAGTGDGIIYTENDVITLVNNSIYKLTGYAQDEIIGKPASFLHPDDYTDDESTAMQKASEQLLAWETGRTEARIQRKDGSVFESALTLSRIGEQGEDTMRVVTVVRDISREIALDKLRTRFIATAAHELRSPISSMKLRMHMLRKRPEDVDKHMERLEQVVERMNRLVSDLLDVASFEHGQITLRKQTFILQDLFNDIAIDHAMLAQNEGLAFIYEAEDDPIAVLLDRHRIEQVFSNLLGNAIRYTEEGTITFSFTIDDENGTFTAKVTDTGQGIPQNEVAFIFEPFYRTMDNKVRGTGLGLSITRDIVTLHDGTIEVDSVLGEGSTFTVVLPIEMSAEEDAG